ncbi:MAG: hypothetical protein ABI821_06985 [Pseudomonadota bacterium]
MKASVLGLVVATAALGGSSIYLWNQLQNERERAAELVAQSADLNARLAQFEKSRGEFGQRRFAGANTFGAQGMSGPGKPPPPVAGAIVNETEAPQTTPWTHRPMPQRSEAMQKMMRAQMRAHNKRLYADVGSTLALNKEQANKLVDLLTDQQSGEIEPFRDGTDAGDYQKAWADRQQKIQGDIAELLGDDKVAALQEYQKSLPARMELEMLTRQLEGYDAAINDDQRERLLKVMVEERDRVPEPPYVDGVDMQEFQKTRIGWEEDYNERVASQARSILNTEQITAYTEYQQAQKDMRAQFGTLVQAGPARPLLRGMSGGNVTFSSTAPAGAAIVATEAVFINAPLEPEQKK